MSKLAGHKNITETAITELHISTKMHPIVGHLKLPGNIADRGLLDVVSLGHWGYYGQAHHFMRRFDGQSPFAAYQESVYWIKSNALKAANDLCRSIARINLSSTMTGDIWLDCLPLGNACHALQDSFSTGHVIRGAGEPGAIVNILKYAGTQKKGHGEADTKWAGKTTFSTSGRHAINATKDLITLVTDAAQQSKPSHVEFQGWEVFRKKWINGVHLSEERDAEIDLIEHYARD